MNEFVKTDIFRLKPAQYVKVVASMWITRWWWAFALPLLAVLLIAVAVDVRFYIVALMMVFIVMPMILAIVYFNYALTPRACRSIINHAVTVTDDGLVIEYENDDEARKPIPPVRIDRADILSYEDDGDSIIVHLVGGRYNLEIIPVQVVGKDAVKNLIALLHVMTHGEEV